MVKLRFKIEFFRFNDNDADSTIALMVFLKQTSKPSGVCTVYMRFNSILIVLINRKTKIS